jgi:hypothetical protein
MQGLDYKERIMEKILIIDGRARVLPSSIAARYAKKAILQGKAVQYKEAAINDGIEKHYGIVVENAFYEKVSSDIDLPGYLWFVKWDIMGKKLINPSVPFPIEKSMRRGKLHIMLQGEWVRANICTTHILFK